LYRSACEKEGVFADNEHFAVFCNASTFACITVELPGSLANPHEASFPLTIRNVIPNGFTTFNGTSKSFETIAEIDSAGIYSKRSRTDIAPQDSERTNNGTMKEVF